MFDYESKGQGFESLPARQNDDSLLWVVIFFLTNGNSRVILQVTNEQGVLTKRRLREVSALTLKPDSGNTDGGMFQSRTPCPSFTPSSALAEDFLFVREEFV